MSNYVLSAAGAFRYPVAGAQNNQENLQPDAPRSFWLSSYESKETSGKSKGDNVVIISTQSRGSPNSESRVSAYWIPQGGSCLIPTNPGEGTLAFTPDFSGCSIVVDQIDDDQYRFYHVQGGSARGSAGSYFDEEYLADGIDHGFGFAGCMRFDDYGIEGRPRAFAVMKYQDGRWWIYFQRQAGQGGIGWAGNEPSIAGVQKVLGGGRIPVADLLRQRADMRGIEGDSRLNRPMPETNVAGYENFPPVGGVEQIA
ncbi:hypothetical protein AA23498_1859 [Acetobacter nitrogenifigens DSM 23921 = NBRC 105050]|uniref:Uncharacterized protein n=2 Tax=Acetobacter nitrogenifigens TaxID=285268 RepID=A0A511X9S5_9PROT|nr:hypothetical protein AA23498_1859 [Acetobacter nitrogenifigens DSM 23921 = NBRC 105050]GEN59699.1 hypothetical protein ANI02nite_15830 [Acetobacter nitrogenifigens DSM 23921 = NBRC 105050]